jgi:serine protease inhibitor ecotin
MATKTGKTAVAENGLRFTSRENGSPFAGMGKIGETMSCMMCGHHKPRSQGSQRRFAGSQAFFCYECKPPLVASEPAVKAA